MLESGLLTPAEAATYLRVSLRSLRRLVARGDLPVTRIGRANRYRQSDLDGYIRKQTGTRASRIAPRAPGIDIEDATWWR
jgi:excisionase family DNA binding protein